VERNQYVKLISETATALMAAAPVVVLQGDAGAMCAFFASAALVPTGDSTNYAPERNPR
jgi:hypothetical protein